MARFSDLPEELVSEILSLLPVDSLMRVKLVQKSWRSLIAIPKFVVKQLQNQTHNRNSPVLLRCHIINDADEKENDLSFLSFDNKIKWTLCVDHLSVYSMIHYRIMGTCHGITCIASHVHSIAFGSIILANPGIREFRELPENCIHRSHGSYRNRCVPLSVGFGYDSRSNDYKVVRLVNCFAAHSTVRVEVYTLSTDSWRELDNIDLIGTLRCFLFPLESLYFNGACYWVAWSGRVEHTSFILSFDMSDEVFRKLPVPDSHSNICHENWKLMYWNEAIAFVYYSVLGTQKSFEIWIMDEFGADGIWKRLFRIGPHPSLCKPVLFLKNDELVMADRDGIFRSYNLSTQETKEITVEQPCGRVFFVNYTRSLVSVRGGTKLDIGDYNFADERLPLI